VPTPGTIPVSPSPEGASGGPLEPPRRRRLLGAHTDEVSPALPLSPACRSISPADLFGAPAMGVAPGVSPHRAPPRRDPPGIPPPVGSRARFSSEEQTRRPSTGRPRREPPRRSPARAPDESPPGLAPRSLPSRIPLRAKQGHHLAGATPQTALLGALHGAGAPGCLPDRPLLGGCTPGVSQRRVLESFSSEEPSILPSTRSLHGSSFPEEPPWRVAPRGFPPVSPESDGNVLHRASTRPFPHGRPSLAAALRSLYFGMTFRREHPSSSPEEALGALLLESTSCPAPRSQTEGPPGGLVQVSLERWDEEEGLGWPPTSHASLSGVP